MCDSNKLVFAIPHESNDKLDVSVVPKAATIFYHGNRWWFDLEPQESPNNELDRRKRNFDWLNQPSNGLNIATGPFGKKICSYGPFVELGLPRYYAFINAGEEFTSSIDYNRKWVLTQNGAFLYLFNEYKSPNDQNCFYELSLIALGISPSDEQ